MMVCSMAITLMVCCLQKVVNVYKRMHTQAQIDKAQLIYIKQCGILIPQEFNGHTVVIDEVNITQAGNIITFECNGIKKTLDKNKSFSVKNNEKTMNKQNQIIHKSNEIINQSNIIKQELNEPSIMQQKLNKQEQEEKRKKIMNKVTQSLKQGK